MSSQTRFPVHEFRPMLRLALPVVLAELGWMAMGVVDLVMVGRVSPEAIGAVGLGRAAFWGVAVFGMGLLLGLDTLIAQAWGAGDREECHRSLFHGVYLALAAAVPITLLLLASPALLARWGVEPAVLEATLPYVRAIAWSALPLLLYTTFRRYLQAIGRVRPVMLALVSANAVNVFFNWVLIFGNLGAPRLGAAGAGWASVASAAYLALFLLVAIRLDDRDEGGGLLRTPRAIEAARMRRLLGLGLPAACQLALEVGVFAAATALAGRLEATWLAAHQVALTLASVTYMVPLGVSSAAAVLVGQSIGRKDGAAAARAGWSALVLGAGFMLVAAAAFLVLPATLARIFTEDAAVIAASVTLLAVAAFFQLFDGVQVVATGALRGAGDTRGPLLWNLVGHWVLGLPVGYLLCFAAGRGAPGLWGGWLVGLTCVGIVLVVRWSRTAAGLAVKLPASDERGTSPG